MPDYDTEPLISSTMPSIQLMLYIHTHIYKESSTGTKANTDGVSEFLHIKRFILRNWLTQLWRLTSSSLPWGLVVGDPREPMVQMKPEGYLLQGCLLLRGLKFCGCWSIHSSPDWVWPTHIREGNLLYSKVCVCACVHVRVTSVMSDSLRPYGLEPARLLCPRDSLGMKTGVGCHALL